MKTENTQNKGAKAIFIEEKVTRPTLNHPSFLLTRCRSDYTIFLNKDKDNDLFEMFLQDVKKIYSVN